MSHSKPYLSVVIPVLNEAECIAQLHEEVVDVCEREGYNYEIIIVDDGSTDGTADIVKKLKPVTYIQLRRNCKQRPWIAELKRRGELIATLDGDRQNDPATSRG